MSEAAESPNEVEISQDNSYIFVTPAQLPFCSDGMSFAKDSTKPIGGNIVAVSFRLFARTSLELLIQGRNSHGTYPIFSIELDSFTARVHHTSSPSQGPRRKPHLYSGTWLFYAPIFFLRWQGASKRDRFSTSQLCQYDSPTLPEADCQFAVGPAGICDASD